MSNQQDYFQLHLFENFQETGILDELKANLRQQLISKLSRQGFDDDQVREAEQGYTEQELFNRKLLVYIVSDYMRTYDINYSYSIFLPEMKIKPEHLLLKQEILTALNIKEKDFQDLAQKKTKSGKDKGQISVIEILLDIASKQFLKECNNHSTQTQLEIDQPAQTKLQDIDDQFAIEFDYHTLQNTASAQEGMVKFKKECERQYQTDLQKELSRIREYEFASVRTEQARQFQANLDQYIKDLDQAYAEKLQRLKDREKNALELCQQRLEEVEQLHHDNRQKHERDIESVKRMELEFEKVKLKENEKISLEKTKITALERDLREQIRKNQDIQQFMNTKIQQKLERHKDDLQKETNSKVSQIQNSTRRSEDDREWVKHLQEQIYHLQSQQDYLQREVQSLRQDVAELQHIRNQQNKDLAALRELNRQLQDSNDAYQDRLMSQEPLLRTMQADQEEVERLLKDTQYMLQNKREEQVQLHQNYALDMQRSGNQLKEIEQIYSYRLEELRMKNKTEIDDLNSKVRNLKSLLDDSEQENSTLRKDLRLVRRIANSQDQDERKLFSTSKSPEQFYDNMQNSQILSNDHDYQQRVESLKQEMESIKSKSKTDFELFKMNHK